MAFFIFQLFVFFIWVFALVALLTRNKKIAFALFTVGAFLVLVEIASVIFSNALFDYKYYAHLTLDIVSGTGGFFFKETLLLIFSYLTTFAGLLFGFQQLVSKRQVRKIFFGLALLVSSGLLFLEEGIFSNLHEIYTIHFAKQKEFKSALAAIDFSDYTLKENTTAKAGKNVILIMLESLEAEFLSDRLAELSPRCRALSEEMNYYNMEPAPGSDYTIGAVYTYLTGFPCFFKNHGNDVFGKSKDVRVNSISSVMDIAGYEQRYLLGNAEFAGTRKMVNLMDIDVRSEKDYDPKYTLEYWGLHDKDLFELAKREVKELSTQDQPFAFYLSTISTHAPDGIFDPRMANTLPKQKSQLELMARALDQHIGEFVDFLKAEDILDNTALFIVPDHLLMGNSSRVMNDFAPDRNLFLITNTTPASYPESDDILQIDMPRIILEGAEIESNINLLTDIIKGDKLSFIKKNKLKLTQLNEASLLAKQAPKPKPSKKKTKKLEAEEGKLALKSIPWTEAHYGQASTIYVNKQQLEAKRGVNLLIYNEQSGDYAHEIFDTYDNDTMVLALQSRLKELVEKGSYFLALTHDSAGDNFKNHKSIFKQIGFHKLAGMQNRKGYLAISNYGLTSEVRKSYPLTLEIPSAPKTSTRSLADIKAQAKDKNRFIAHAGGRVQGKTYTNSLEALNESYKDGFRIFELDIIKTTDHQYVACHDWEHWKKNTGYYQDVPVDLATFKEYKLSGLQTLDMDAINQWFALHPDAILMTDKVNDPEKFAAQFQFPDRLMMELFSWDAIEKAQAIGIKAPVMSQNLMEEVGYKKALTLIEKHNIKHMAVSRRNIDKRPDYFKKLLDQGIKVYGFHVNFDDLKDESFMAREAFDYCYGLYADEWDLN